MYYNTHRKSGSDITSIDSGQLFKKPTVVTTILNEKRATNSASSKRTIGGQFTCVV